MFTRNVQLCLCSVSIANLTCLVPMVPLITAIKPTENLFRTASVLFYIVKKSKRKLYIFRRYEYVATHYFMIPRVYGTNGVLTSHVRASSMLLKSKVLVGTAMRSVRTRFRKNRSTGSKVEMGDTQTHTETESRRHEHTDI
jgi:hypothetical protein